MSQEQTAGRRRFIAKASAAAAATLVPRHVLGGPGTRKLLKWDAPGMRATNAPEADQYLRESYRAGWDIPA